LPAPNEAPHWTVICATLAFESAWICFEPCLIMPARSASLPTMNPVVFCSQTIGVPSWQQAWTKWVTLVLPAGSSGPLLVTMPTRKPAIAACPHTVPGPYSALNSRNSEASTMRAITWRMSTAFLASAPNRPSSASLSCSGGGPSGQVARGCQPSAATSSRAVASALASSSATCSASPDTLACMSAPPSASSVATSPVAALSKGGPARKARARPRTMIT
jgi:hypothetical protein